MGSEWDKLKSFLPQSFGSSKTRLKPKEESVDKSLFDKTARAEKKALPFPEQSVDNDDLDDSEEQLPITHQIKLGEHVRPVTALSLDPAGARLVTGARDADVKFWDFSGMDMTLKSWKTMEVYEGTPIRDVQFSNSGDRLLIATGSLHVKLYDRDGNELVEYMKGDPYLRDMKNTKGHVASVTNVRWHPHEKNEFLSSSIDGTVRIWDASNKWRQRNVIAVKSKLPGGRTPIYSCSYSPDGKLIAASGQDGALWVWNSNGPFIKPTMTLENAHMQGSGASGLAFSMNNYHITTRGLDDTVKLFDIRNFKSPVATQSNLLNFFEESNIIFSPDNRFIVTGVSVKKEGKGRLVLLDKTTLDIVHDLPLDNTSVCKVLWHPKINQIICGTGDGGTFVMYNPSVSTRGAIMCVSRKQREKAVDDIDFGQYFTIMELFTIRFIYHPDALPLFQEDLMDDIWEKKRKRRNEVRADPILSKRPEIPNVAGPGQNGQLGSNETANLIRGILKDTTRDEDPREAILRHAKAAAEDPYWVAPAYKKTQPKPVFAKSVYEDEEEEKADALKKRRQ